MKFAILECTIELATVTGVEFFVWASKHLECPGVWTRMMPLQVFRCGFDKRAHLVPLEDLSSKKRSGVYGGDRSLQDTPVMALSSIFPTPLALIDSPGRTCDSLPEDNPTLEDAFATVNHNYRCAFDSGFVHPHVIPIRNALITLGYGELQNVAYEVLKSPKGLMGRLYANPLDLPAYVTCPELIGSGVGAWYLYQNNKEAPPMIATVTDASPQLAEKLASEAWIHSMPGRAPLTERYAFYAQEEREITGMLQARQQKFEVHRVSAGRVAFVPSGLFVEFCVPPGGLVLCCFHHPRSNAEAPEFSTKDLNACGKVNYKPDKYEFSGELLNTHGGGEPILHVVPRKGRKFEFHFDSSRWDPDAVDMALMLLEAVRDWKGVESHDLVPVVGEQPGSKVKKLREGESHALVPVVREQPGSKEGGGLREEAAGEPPRATNEP